MKKVFKSTISILAFAAVAFAGQESSAQINPSEAATLFEESMGSTTNPCFGTSNTLFKAHVGESTATLTTLRTYLATHLGENSDAEKASFLEGLKSQIDESIRVAGAILGTNHKMDGFEPTEEKPETMGLLGGLPVGTAIPYGLAKFNLFVRALQNAQSMVVEALADGDDVQNEGLKKAARSLLLGEGELEADWDFEAEATTPAHFSRDESASAPEGAFWGTVRERYTKTLLLSAAFEAYKGENPTATIPSMLSDIVGTYYGEDSIAGIQSSHVITALNLPTRYTFSGMGQSTNADGSENPHFVDGIAAFPWRVSGYSPSEYAPESLNTDALVFPVDGFVFGGGHFYIDGTFDMTSWAAHVTGFTHDSLPLPSSADFGLLIYNVNRGTNSDGTISTGEGTAAGASVTPASTATEEEGEHTDDPHHIELTSMEKAMLAYYDVAPIAPDLSNVHPGDIVVKYFTEVKRGSVFVAAGTHASTLGDGSTRRDILTFEANRHWPIEMDGFVTRDVEVLIDEDSLEYFVIKPKNLPGDDDIEGAGEVDDGTVVATADTSDANADGAEETKGSEDDGAHLEDDSAPHSTAPDQTTAPQAATTSSVSAPAQEGGTHHHQRTTSIVGDVDEDGDFDLDVGGEATEGTQTITVHSSIAEDE